RYDIQTGVVDSDCLAVCGQEWGIPPGGGYADVLALQVLRRFDRSVGGCQYPKAGIVALCPQDFDVQPARAAENHGACCGASHFELVPIDPLDGSHGAVSARYLHLDAALLPEPELARHVDEGILADRQP